MTLELTPEQKANDIRTRIAAARAEVAAILEKHQVEIGATMEPVVLEGQLRGHMAMPSFIDIKYRKGPPSPLQPKDL